MKTQSRRLVPPGGLFDETFEVATCESEQELIQAFAWARNSGKRLTLMGSARSFGYHFRPVAGGAAVDISALGRGARTLSEEPDGSLWIRAGGGTRFCDLKELYPSHRVLCPPTSDHVTLAGALAACVHNTNGYFAADVRAFRLVTPSGEVYECNEAAEGLSGELFRAAPGAFGALGATTEIEVKLHLVAEAQLFGVHAVFAGPSRDGRYLDVLEATRDDPKFTEGAGAVVYGNRGHAIVLGDEKLPPGHVPDKQQALLTDEALEQHAFTQGLANRFPRIAESTVTRTYPQGIMRWAPWYGFQYFQRGFDRSFEVLGRPGLKYRAARLLGVDRRLPVRHQAWFFPRAELRAFMDCYFTVLDRFPGIEKRVEQQDIVLLPVCSFPAHSAGQQAEPLGVLTASYSVAGLSENERKGIEGFFRDVSEESFARIRDCRVSLSKQIHADPDLLRKMHAPWRDLIKPLRAQVDPDGMLTSGHLETLLEN